MEKSKEERQKRIAKILTTVFNSSRLYVEVKPYEVEMLMNAREIEKQRSKAIMEKVREVLVEANYECERKMLVGSSSKNGVILSARVKSLVSAMYNLHATKNGEPQDLNDMLGLMIICEDDPTCYKIRELLLKAFKSEKYFIIKDKDLIANPKPNGYQSIHLHVDNGENIVFEVQIKSFKMFAYSQTGDCSHDERYKARLNSNKLNEEESIIYDSLREVDWL